MRLATSEMDSIRDYVGTQVPTNTEIYVMAADCSTWPEVALRILRRRLADITAGGGTTSVSIDGVMSVSFTRADVSSISASIMRLEQIMVEDAGGSLVTVGRIVRPDRR